MVKLAKDEFNILLNTLKNKNTFDILEKLLDKEPLQPKDFKLRHFELNRVLEPLENIKIIKSEKIERGIKRGKYYSFTNEDCKNIIKDIIKLRERFSKVYGEIDIENEE